MQNNPLQQWQRSVDLAIRQGQPVPIPSGEPFHFPRLSAEQYRAWMIAVQGAIERRYICDIPTPGQWLASREQAQKQIDPWDAATQHRIAVSQGKAQCDAE